MKLNSPRKSGWRGRYGWRNIFDVFIREKRRKKKVQKAVKVLSENSSVPFEKSLVVYSPAVQVRTVEIPIPIPTMSMQSLLMLAILVIILGIGLISFAVFKYVNDEIDYKERVRMEVIYSIQKTLEPYVAQQEELKLKISELDNYMVANPITRARIIKKYKNIQTGTTIEKEDWK